MTMRDMTEAEQDAYHAMFDGDLEPLADILKREEPDVHPLLQRRLYELIRGRSDQIDFKLVPMPYPNMGRNGVRAQQSTQSEGVQVAMKMALHGAFKRLRWKGALADTMKDLEMGRTKVTDYWSEHKDSVAFCIKAGHMEIRDDYKPDA